MSLEMTEMDRSCVCVRTNYGRANEKSLLLSHCCCSPFRNSRILLHAPRVNSKLTDWVKWNFLSVCSLGLLETALDLVNWFASTFSAFFAFQFENNGQNIFEHLKGKVPTRGRNYLAWRIHFLFWRKTATRQKKRTEISHIKLFDRWVDGYDR